MFRTIEHVPVITCAEQRQYVRSNGSGISDGELLQWQQCFYAGWRVEPSPYDHSYTLDEFATSKDYIVCLFRPDDPSVNYIFTLWWMRSVRYHECNSAVCSLHNTHTLCDEARDIFSCIEGYQCTGSGTYTLAFTKPDLDTCRKVCIKSSIFTQEMRRAMSMCNHNNLRFPNKHEIVCETLHLVVIDTEKCEAHVSSIALYDKYAFQLQVFQKSEVLLPDVESTYNWMSGADGSNVFVDFTYQSVPFVYKSLSSQYGLPADVDISNLSKVLERFLWGLPGALHEQEVNNKPSGEIEFIPIGRFCMCAEVLKLANMRKLAYPFDFLFTTAEFIQQCVKERFEPFLHLLYNTCGSYKDKGFASMPHHSVHSSDVRSTFIRRIQRVNRVRNAKTPTVLLYAEYPYETSCAPSVLEDIAMSWNDAHTAVVFAITYVTTDDTALITCCKILPHVYNVNVPIPTTATRPTLGEWRYSGRLEDIGEFLKTITPAILNA